jgi:hypothetical protein
MKNVDQNIQGASEPLSGYQIINNIPEKQAIVLQNTDQTHPIQLRVDPVTDYTALWITVLASVLASIITAFLTIILVRSSNKILLKGQLEQQKILLDEQTRQLDKQLAHQINIQKIELKNNNTKEIMKEYKELLYTITTSLDNVAIFTCQYFRIRLAYKSDPTDSNNSHDKVEQFGGKTSDLFDTIRFSVDNFKILLQSHSIESNSLQYLLDDALKYMTAFYSAVNNDYENDLINDKNQLDISALSTKYENLITLKKTTNSIRGEGIAVLKSLADQIKE